MLVSGSYKFDDKLFILISVLLESYCFANWTCNSLDSILKKNLSNGFILNVAATKVSFATSNLINCFEV